MTGPVTGARRSAVTATAMLILCSALLGACGVPRYVPVSAPDTRTRIFLSRKESEDLRRGMRSYLESIQGIVDAAGENDMARVAKRAEASGMGMVADVSPAIITRLPPQFIVLSIDTHHKFEQLAVEAARNGSSGRTMDRLRGILANCTTCHSAYRLAP